MGLHGGYTIEKNGVLPVTAVIQVHTSTYLVWSANRFGLRAQSSVQTSVRAPSILNLSGLVPPPQPERARSFDAT